MPIYKQSDGGYRVQIAVYENGKRVKQIVRKNKDTATRAGALRVEYELLSKYKYINPSNSSQGPQNDLLNITLNDVIEDYFNLNEKSLRRSTRQHAEKNIRLYIREPLGSLTLNTFMSNPQPLVLWKHRLDMTAYKVSYKNDVYKTLHVIFNFAKRIYGLGYNPLDRIGPFKDANQWIDDKELHYWTLEQFLRFDEELRAECEVDDSYDQIRHWSYYVFFNLLFFCGMRKGEAYPLRWTDIKNKGNYYVISITKSLGQKTRDENGEYEITPPKNRSSVREVPLCARMVRILKEHYERCKKVVDFNPTKDTFLICGILSPLSDTELDNIKNRVAERLGLPRIRIHDFRHSFVSLLINSDVNIKTISKLVGHSTVDQTWNTYGHLYPDKENEAVKLIDSLIK